MLAPRPDYQPEARLREGHDPKIRRPLCALKRRGVVRRNVPGRNPLAYQVRARNLLCGSWSAEEAVSTARAGRNLSLR